MEEAKEGLLVVYCYRAHILGLFVACLCSVNRSLSVRLVSPMYCFLHRFHQARRFASQIHQ